MSWSDLFKFSSSHIILTVLVIFLFYLFEIIYFEDLFQVVSGIIISYLVAAVLIYVYRSVVKGVPVLPRVIAFDAGGVYFTGNYYTEEIIPREGFNELIAELKAKGHTVIMLTNQNKMVSDFIADKFDLNEVFDQVLSSGDIQIAKPDPRIFLKVVEQLGINLENFIFVDDYLPNVEGAQKAGVTGIQFQSVEQLRSEFRKLKVL